MQRDQLILRADYDQLHKGMRRVAKSLAWKIIDELPTAPEELAKVVTLETLALRKRERPIAPELPEALGPLDSEKLPTMPDSTEEVEAVEAVEPIAVDAIDALPRSPAPTLEQYTAAGYNPSTYDQFLKGFLAEQDRAAKAYAAEIKRTRAQAEVPRQTAPMRTFAAAGGTVADIESSWDSDEGHT